MIVNLLIMIASIFILEMEYCSSEIETRPIWECDSIWMLPWNWF